MLQVSPNATPVVGSFLSLARLGVGGLQEAAHSVVATKGAGASEDQHAEAKELKASQREGSRESMSSNLHEAETWLTIPGADVTFSYNTHCEPGEGYRTGGRPEPLQDEEFAEDFRHVVQRVDVNVRKYGDQAQRMATLLAKDSTSVSDVEPRFITAEPFHESGLNLRDLNQDSPKANWMRGRTVPEDLERVFFPFLG